MCIWSSGIVFKMSLFNKEIWCFYLHIVEREHCQSQWEQFLLSKGLVLSQQVVFCLNYFRIWRKRPYCLDQIELSLNRPAVDMQPLVAIQTVWKILRSLSKRGSSFHTCMDIKLTKEFVMDWHTHTPLRLAAEGHTNIPDGVHTVCFSVKGARYIREDESG